MGKFQAGQQKPKSSGRKKGTPNNATKDLRSLLDKSGVSIPERILDILPELSPEKRADVLLILMNYIYPKRKAIEISEVDSSQITNQPFKIEFVKAKDGKPA